MSWDFYAEFNVSFLFIIVFLPSLFFAFYRKFILSFSSIAFRNWFLEIII